MTFHEYEMDDDDETQPILEIKPHEQLYRCFIATVPNSPEVESVKILSKINNRGNVKIATVFKQLDGTKHYKYSRWMPKAKFTQKTSLIMNEIDKEFFKGLNWQEATRYHFHLKKEKIT